MIMATRIGGMACGCVTTRGCTGEIYISHCDLHGGHIPNNYVEVVKQLEKLIEEAHKKKRKTIKISEINRVLLVFRLGDMDIFNDYGGCF